MTAEFITPDMLEPGPQCDRCHSPGEFRGGRCYGCIQTTQALDAAIVEIDAVRILTIYLENGDDDPTANKARRIATQAIHRLEALRDGR